MRRIFATTLLIAAVTTSGPFAFGGSDPSGLRHWETASEDPDRIFLSFDGDTATTRAVTWRTDASVETAYAEIAPAIAEPGFDQFARRITAETTAVDLNRDERNTQGIVHYHSVVFNDLNPDTLYAYWVGDGQSRWSEWIQFRTASKEAKPFSFLYFGDSQNDVLSHCSRVFRMADLIAPDARFALHAGDLSNTAHSDREWAEWFKAGGPLHAEKGGLPVIGNHEYRGGLSGVTPYNTSVHNGPVAMSQLWRPQFTLPVVSSLPEKLNETVYTVDYQGARIIVLNSNLLIEEQLPYIEEQLKEPGFQWRIVTFHHPIFSDMKRAQKTAAQKAKWKELFERYNVDLVLQGHNHVYTRKQVPGKTLYITSVCGPKQYTAPKSSDPATDGYELVRFAENTQLFQVIAIDGNKLSYKSYTAIGDLYDAATLTKDFATGERKITQQIPDVAPRTYANTAEKASSYLKKKDAENHR